MMFFFLNWNMFRATDGHRLPHIFPKRAPSNIKHHDRKLELLQIIYLQEIYL